MAPPGAAPDPQPGRVESDGGVVVGSPGVTVEPEGQGRRNRQGAEDPERGTHSRQGDESHHQMAPADQRQGAQRDRQSRQGERLRIERLRHAVGWEREGRILHGFRVR